MDVKTGGSFAAKQEKCLRPTLKRVRKVHTPVNDFFDHQQEDLLPYSPPADHADSPPAGRGG